MGGGQMSYIENVEMFDRFSRGEYVRDINKLNDTAIWLKPEDMDVGGGRMKLYEIDKLKDYPNSDIISITGLDQEGFEYFIKNYGKQFKIIQFFKNKKVQDWSLLATLPDLEYLYYFFNQGIERLWNMTENKKLRGISILDFSRLKSLKGIETAENLEYFCLGNAVWDKCEVDSYRYFADTNVRYLRFWGKKILDRNPSYLVSMKKLKGFQGVMQGLSREQFAWVKANAVNPLEIGPTIATRTDLETKSPYCVAVFPWKGQRSYKLESSEQRFARDVEQFNALVEQFRGVPYESLFSFAEKPE